MTLFKVMQLPELLTVFLISFISDLDNIIIYVTILKRYASSFAVVLFLAVFLALNRTVYVSVVHYVYGIPGFELAVGLILIIIAWKMAVDQVDLTGKRAPALLNILLYVILIDLLLSIDGVLIVSQISEIPLVVFLGFACSLFTLLVFSRVVFDILKYFPFFYVIAASFIGYVAMENIVNDQLIFTLLLSFDHSFPSVNILPMFSKITALLIICLGLHVSLKNNRF